MLFSAQRDGKGRARKRADSRRYLQRRDGSKCRQIICARPPGTSGHVELNLLSRCGSRDHTGHHWLRGQSSDGHVKQRTTPAAAGWGPQAGPGCSWLVRGARRRLRDQAGQRRFRRALPALAAELVAANVDIIVTSGTPNIEAAQNATKTIPIVMAAVGDAVGGGFVASLAHPGGNLTGLTLVASEQSTKRLNILKDALPAITSASVLWNPDNISHVLQFKQLELGCPGTRGQAFFIPRAQH